MFVSINFFEGATRLRVGLELICQTIIESLNTSSKFENLSQPVIMLPVLLVEVQALHAALPKVAAVFVLLRLLPKGNKRLDRLQKVKAY